MTDLARSNQRMQAPQQARSHREIEGCDGEYQLTVVLF